MRSAITLLLISSCATAAFAREEVKRDFSRTAPLPAGRQLRIEHRHGRVSVKTHNRPEVQIAAVIRCSAPTANEARGCADRIQVIVQESASGVSVRTEFPQNLRNVGFSVECDITMPDTSPLDLRNQFGSVDVSSLHANATIRNGNGPVAFLAGKGQHRIENSFGNTEVRNNDGDVTIVNGNGSVLATDITGALDITNRFASIRVANAGRSLTIHSNNGNIEADNIGGIANISNTFGRVAVNDAKSDLLVQNQNGDVAVNGVAGNAGLNTTFAAITFTKIGKGLTVHAQNAQIRGDGVGESAAVETTFGAVDLRNVRGGAKVTTGNSPVKLATIGGEVYTRSSFAAVTITDSPGPVTVEAQNGPVVVEAKNAGACKPMSLRTTFGLIRATIPAGIGYNLSAQTTFGRIHAGPGVQIAVTGDISPNNLSGKIGAGGCDLRLTAQNSNIDILSR
ncbi:MAG TPA: hypothetical protein VL371_21175 [Gemmataceae bacterium]|nr:hypothetical protein [Gemmataceae bacterium]